MRKISGRAEQQIDACCMDDTEVARRGLLIAGGDGSEALEVMEETFDPVANSIELPGEARFAFPFRFRMDDRLQTLSANLGAKLI